MSIIWDFGHRELTGCNFRGTSYERKQILELDQFLWLLVAAFTLSSFQYVVTSLEGGNAGQVTTIASHN